MTRRLLLPATLLFLAPAVPLAAQETPVPADMAADVAPGVVIVAEEDVQYEPIEVPGFDSGMEIAVLSGDPYAEGPYVLRLAFPDGYTFPPHWHPMAENVTVLEGTFLLAMGETEGEAEPTEYGPGDFLHIPAEHPHYGGADGRTAIQLHGTGPFEINVVE